MNFEYAPFPHLKERSFSSINHAYIFLTLLLVVSVHPLTLLAPFFSTCIFFHSFFLLFFRLFFQPIWYHFFSYRFLRCTAFLLRLSPFLILTVSSFANAIASATVPTFCVPNVSNLLHIRFASFISERSIT